MGDKSFDICTYINVILNEPVLEFDSKFYNYIIRRKEIMGKKQEGYCDIKDLDRTE